MEQAEKSEKTESQQGSAKLSLIGRRSEGLNLESTTMGKSFGSGFQWAWKFSRAGLGVKDL